MKNCYFLCFSLLIAQTTLGQTKSQKVRFTNFSLLINNFYSECYNYTRFSEGNEIPPQKVGDSIFICETPCDSNGWYINGQTIFISSKSATDTYELSYANEYDISQGFDSRYAKAPAEGWEEWDKKRQDWKYISKYKKVNQLSINRFKLPYRKNYTSKSDLTNLKQKFGLQDTLIEIPREVGMESLVFTKDNRLFSFETSYLILRLKRFSSGQLKEIKYVLVAISEGCD